MITSPQNYSLLLSPQKSQPPNQTVQSPQNHKPKPTKTAQKDILISKLQSTNLKLKNQISKIQKQMQNYNQSQRDLLQNISKRQSLFDNDNDVMLQKQLQNAYKQIHMYEYQIKKLQDDPNKISLENKRSQTEIIVRQKKQMLYKLKEKYVKQLKITQDNDKKLNNSNLKQIFDEEIGQLHNQLRIIKEKIAGLQRTQVYKKQNMMKQHNAIKKLENQLLEMGMADGTLQEVKQRALKGIGISNNRRQSKNNNSIMLNSNNSKTIQKNIQNSSNINLPNMHNNKKTLQQFEQSAQKNDLSYQTYKRQTNQISLLDKVVSDYQRMIVQGQLEKQQAIKLNQQSKNQLLSCQQEIEKLQRYLIQLKSKINPANMKPIKQYRSMTTKPNDNPAKIHQTPLIVKMPVIVKNKSISHLLKHDEIGFPSQKGDKFTDRNILGRTNLKAKIIGGKIFTSKASNMVIGMQMIYSGNKRGGQYIKKQIPEQLYNKQQFQCNRPHYIKHIYGSLTSQNKLSQIIFISSNKLQYKYGLINNKKFTFQLQNDQYPTCLYGSLILGKQNKKQMSFIEYLGVQIQNEESKQDKKI